MEEWKKGQTYPELYTAVAVLVLSQYAMYPNTKFLTKPMKSFWNIFLAKFLLNLFSYF